jgi:hypothetical protein
MRFIIASRAFLTSHSPRHFSSHQPSHHSSSWSSGENQKERRLCVTNHLDEYMQLTVKAG